MKVYSPYSDRYLWINPEYINKYGPENAKAFVVNRDKGFMQFFTNTCGMMSDHILITDLEFENAEKLEIDN